jgi:peptidoglycan/LPS O-acetylase OafA/YrhL
MGLLRLVLAVSVLLAHMGNFVYHTKKTLLGFTFIDSAVAVQCFFMLSGFYMALVLNEKYRGPGSYFTFITQRFFRLFPTYWLVLGGILLAELLIAATHGNRHENTYTLQFWLKDYSILAWPTWAVLGVSNLTLFGLNDISPLFVNQVNGHLCVAAHAASMPASAYTIDPPAWSLGVEVFFYLFAPFLVRRTVAWQATLFFGLAGLRLGLEYGLHIPYLPYIFVSAPLQFPFFLAGSLAYRLYRNRASFPRLYARSGLPWLFLLILISLFYHRLPFAKSAWVALYPVLFISIPALFALTRNNFWDRQIGELSYPFYLIHYFVIELANVAADYITFPTSLVTPACLVVTFAFSIAITQLFENRVDRFRASLFRRSKTHILASENQLLSSAQ